MGLGEPGTPASHSGPSLKEQFDAEVDEYIERCRSMLLGVTWCTLDEPVTRAIARLMLRWPIDLYARGYALRNKSSGIRRVLLSIDHPDVPPLECDRCIPESLDERQAERRIESFVVEFWAMVGREFMGLY